MKYCSDVLLRPLTNALSFSITNPDKSRNRFQK